MVRIYSTHSRRFMLRHPLEMTRDTEELPAIIAELEETAVLMEQSWCAFYAQESVHTSLSY